MWKLTISLLAKRKVDLFARPSVFLEKRNRMTSAAIPNRFQWVAKSGLSGLMRFGKYQNYGRNYGGKCEFISPDFDAADCPFVFRFCDAVGLRHYNPRWWDRISNLIFHKVEEKGIIWGGGLFVPVRMLPRMDASGHTYYVVA